MKFLASLQSKERGSHGPFWRANFQDHSQSCGLRYVSREVLEARKDQSACRSCSTEPLNSSMKGCWCRMMRPAQFRGNLGLAPARRLWNQRNHRSRPLPCTSARAAAHADSSDSSLGQGCSGANQVWEKSLRLAVSSGLLFAAGLLAFARPSAAARCALQAFQGGPQLGVFSLLHHKQHLAVCSMTAPDSLPFALLLWYPLALEQSQPSRC